MAEAKRAGAQLERPTTNDLGCRWYVAQDGDRRGPYRYEELLAAARSGDIAPGAHVWRPGFDHWIAVSARPDLVAVLPPRPTLTAVPPSLDAAAAAATEELRWSRDVVGERAEGAIVPPPPPAPTIDLPRMPSLESLEVEALEALDRPRPSSGPVPELEDGAIEAIPYAETSADASVTDLGLVAVEADAIVSVEAAPASVADLADRLEASPAPAATEDVMLGEIDGALRRERRQRLVLMLALAGLTVGLGALAWGVESRSALPAPLREAPPYEPASDPVPMQPVARPPTVQQVRLQPSAPAAAAQLAVAASPPPRPTAPKAAPSSTRKAATKDLGWLNRRSAPAADPEPVLVNQARATPRRFRISAPEPQARLELPVSLPEGLSDELAGRTVAARLSTFAHCARFDRLSNDLPAGAMVALTVDREGKVASARAEGAPSEIARCLERSARRLTFAAFTRPSERVEVTFARGGTVRARVVR